MRLVSKIARIRMGDDLWYSGDDILLPDITVEIGEEERASTCEFSVYDPGLILGGKYQKISFEAGGIQVPPELLQAPNNPVTAAGSASAPPATPGSTTTASGNLSVNMRAMLDTIGWAEGANYNTLYGINRTFSDFSDHPRSTHSASGITSSAAGRYQFLERTWNSLNLPDFSPANQDRGCVMLIERRGATAAVEAGDIPRALQTLSYEWASLPPYRYPGQGSKTQQEVVNYFRSRVAHYQQQGGTTPPPEPPATTMQPAQPAQPAVQETSPPVESSFKGTEVIVEIGFDPSNLVAFHFIHMDTDSSWSGEGHVTTFKGQSVRWLLTCVPQTRAFENMSLNDVAQTFGSGFNLAVEMEGAGVSYQHLDMTGLTPYQVLRREAQQQGFRIADNGVRIQIEPAARPHFTNLTLDEDLLLSATFSDQARAASNPTPGAALSQPQQGATASPTAIDRQTGSVTQSQPQDVSGTDVAPGEGGLVTGVPAPPVTGIAAPAAAASSTPAPAASSTAVLPGDRRVEPAQTRTEESEANGVQTKREISTQRTLERGRITIVEIIKTTVTPPGGTNTLTTTTTYTTEGTTTLIQSAQDGHTSEQTRRSPQINKDVLATLSETATATTTPQQGDPNGFGLPRQPPGAIDLADGRAEPSAMVSEAQRIKGFESICEMRLCDESLKILPGQIVGFSGRLFPPPFNREWRVNRVKHSFKGSTTQLSFYTPQAPPPAATTATEGGSSAPSILNNQTPTLSGYILPCGGRIGDGYGPRAGRRAGYRHRILDIAAPGGTPVVAMNNGTVTDVVSHCRVGNFDCGGGWGNFVLVQHGDGVFTRYCHLSSVEVTEGQQVQRGQIVGRVGNTGHSYGNHLHLDVRRGSGSGEVVLLSSLGIELPGSLTGSKRSGFQY